MAKFPKDTTRAWLKKSLLTNYIKDFSFNLGIEIGSKKPIKRMKGKFDIADTTLKIAPNLKPLQNIEGVVKLTDKKLNIEIDSLYLGRDELKNITAKIPRIARGKTELHVNTKLDRLKTNNLFYLLLAETTKRKSLDKLNNVFENSNISGDLNLKLKLGGKFNMKQLQISLDGKLDGEIKSFISQNSESLLTLEKNYDDPNFYLDFDLNKANFTLPLLSYKKKIGEDMNLSFAILNDIKRTLFNDIKAVSGNNIINASLIFDSRGFKDS